MTAGRPAVLERDLGRERLLRAIGLWQCVDAAVMALAWLGLVLSGTAIGALLEADQGGSAGRYLASTILSGLLPGAIVTLLGTAWFVLGVMLMRRVERARQVTGVALVAVAAVILALAGYLAATGHAWAMIAFLMAAGPWLVVSILTSRQLRQPRSAVVCSAAYGGLLQTGPRALPFQGNGFWGHLWFRLSWGGLVGIVAGLTAAGLLAGGGR